MAPLARRYGSRLVILATLFLAHVLVFLQLAKLRALTVKTDASERMSVTFIDLPPNPVKPPISSGANSPASTIAGRKRNPQPREFAITPPTQVNREAPSDSVDWMAEGQRAAASIATDELSSRRSFGPRAPQRLPQQQRKPFAWDKTQTQRVETLPEGGILIRLNDKCALVLAPLPTGGCKLGRSEPRGDLFDELKGPIALGDWKDAGPP